MSEGRALPQAAYDAYRHVALEATGSTNAEGLARARAGDPGKLWITAGRQTEGRARRGRSWTSEPGNLYASLLLIDPAPAAALASLPLAVAVAVRDAVQSVLPPGAGVPDIKWPNDVLIHGRKVSGILLEAEQLPDGRQALVIGCGINIAHAPEAALYPVTRLGAEGATAAPDEVFAHLLIAMADMLALWDRGAGLSAVIARWRRHAIGLGRPITVRLTSETLLGRFDDIDDEGRLVLTEDSGRRRLIAAGDVFFG